MKSFILGTLLLITSVAFSQTSHVIELTATREIYLPKGPLFAYQPGDTFKIKPVVGGYVSIIINNFHGTADKPIVITNDGDVQVVTNGMRIDTGASYFKIVGTGSKSIKYGFLFGQAGSPAGLAIGRAHHYKVENIESAYAEAGLLFKVNPTLGDAATQYPNNVIDDVEISNCWVHNTVNEGMYIGHTYPPSDPYHNNLVPIRMNNVRIHDCLVEYTGWDGIQLSNAQNGCAIYNNIVRHFGMSDAGSQRAGIILGANTTGSVYNNYVWDGTGNGLQLFGYGDVYCYTNTVENVGNTLDPSANGNGEQSIFTKAGGHFMPEDRPMQVIHIYTNTIKSPKRRGILQTNNDANYSDYCYFENNLIYFDNTLPFDWLTYISISQVNKIINGNQVFVKGSTITTLPIKFKSFTVKRV